jgi:hypothetical protein
VARWHFGSALCTWRRAAVDGARCGGAGQRMRQLKHREVEDAPELGRTTGPKGCAGRCKVFGPGEQGGSSGLRWAKKPERLGPAWEFPWKIQIGLPRPIGRIEERNRKGP